MRRGRVPPQRKDHCPGRRDHVVQDEDVRIPEHPRRLLLTDGFEAPDKDRDRRNRVHVQRQLRQRPTLENRQDAVHTGNFVEQREEREDLRPHLDVHEPKERRYIALQRGLRQAQVHSWHGLVLVPLVPIAESGAGAIFRATWSPLSHYKRLWPTRYRSQGFFPVAAAPLQDLTVSALQVQLIVAVHSLFPVDLPVSGR